MQCVCCSVCVCVNILIRLHLFLFTNINHWVPLSAELSRAETATLVRLYLLVFMTCSPPSTPNLLIPPVLLPILLSAPAAPAGLCRFDSLGFHT